MRTEKKLLDECHGAFDELTGEYRYYLLPSAPYMPPCLRGAQLGNVSSFRSRKDGEPCSKSESHSMQTSIMAGGKLLTGTGPRSHGHDDVQVPPERRETNQHPIGWGSPLLKYTYVFCNYVPATTPTA